MHRHWWNTCQLNCRTPHATPTGPHPQVRQRYAGLVAEDARYRQGVLIHKGIFPNTPRHPYRPHLTLRFDMSAMEQSMGGALPGCAYDHAQYGERMRKVRAYGTGLGQRPTGRWRGWSGCDFQRLQLESHASSASTPRAPAHRTTTCWPHILPATNLTHPQHPHPLGCPRPLPQHPLPQQPAPQQSHFGSPMPSAARRRGGCCAAGRRVARRRRRRGWRQALLHGGGPRGGGGGHGEAGRHRHHQLRGAAGHAVCAQRAAAAGCGRSAACLRMGATAGA